MSFLDQFQKLKTSFGGEDKEKKEVKEEKYEGHDRQYDSAPRYEYQPSAGPLPPGPPESYGYEQQYQNREQPPYGGPPPSGPPAPPGWRAQWDQSSQRWYYIETETGRTEWSPPSYPSGLPPPQTMYGGYPVPGQESSRGESGGYYGGGGGYPGGPPPSNDYVYQGEHRDGHGNDHGGDHGEKEKKKEDKGYGGMVAAGVGGLAVGAVGGALIGHAMADDSDDEHHRHHDESFAPPLQPISEPEEYPSSASSSDVEELEEAREELEEAQEEYEEACDEVYDD